MFTELFWDKNEPTGNFHNDSEQFHDNDRRLEREINSCLYFVIQNNQNPTWVKIPLRIGFQVSAQKSPYFVIQDFHLMKFLSKLYKK